MNNSEQIVQEILQEVEKQPSGLIGPQPKGASPGLPWVARLVKRLGVAVEDGIWSPAKFRRGMLEVAACAVAAILWADRHYLAQKE